MSSINLYSPLVAEFIGAVLGDGSIGEYECRRTDGKNSVQKVVKFTISKDEKEYAEHLNQIFEELFDYELIESPRKDENTLDLRCFRSEVFEKVTSDLGLKKSPKKGRAVIPSRYIGTELEYDILRGLFDTDGSLVLTDNNGYLYPRLEIKVSRSPLQDQLKDILDRREFNYGAYNAGSGKLRFQMNGKEQLSKWIETVGFNNQRHISKLEKL